MKTKYVKVKGADPIKRGHYFIKTKNSSFLKGDYFHYKDKIWGNTNKKDVEYWLEEIPDREEEMKEILQTYVSEFKARNFSAETLKKAEKLLNELK